MLNTIAVSQNASKNPKLSQYSYFIHEFSFGTISLTIYIKTHTLCARYIYTHTRTHIQKDTHEFNELSVVAEDFRVFFFFFLFRERREKDKSKRCDASEEEDVTMRDFQKRRENVRDVRQVQTTKPGELEEPVPDGSSAEDERAVRADRSKSERVGTEDFGDDG